MTLPQILDAIQNSILFGAMECDIHVPDRLKHAYTEMCHIFKKTNTSLDDTCGHMETFERERNIMAQPYPSLIGTTFGGKILLATKLIKCYVDHGLQITCVYQVIALKPSCCF